ncbi:MAG: hypothetical protein GY820_00365 [Gammaproteobacteria bacterium]|nr:hypothetical protein [Gammaproteobacteria bacterium]
MLGQFDMAGAAGHHQLFHIVPQANLIPLGNLVAHIGNANYDWLIENAQGDRCVEWLARVGLIANERQCPLCPNPMSLVRDNTRADGYFVR